MNTAKWFVWWFYYYEVRYKDTKGEEMKELKETKGTKEERMKILTPKHMLQQPLIAIVQVKPSIFGLFLY